MIHRLHRPGRQALALQLELDAAIDGVCRLPQRDRHAFWDLVGHPGQRLDVGGTGLMAVSVDAGNGLFEPAQDGPRAIIMPVRDAPKRAGGHLIDLIAWLPRSGAVYRRFGHAAALGEWHCFDPLPPPSLHVFNDPASWARSNAEGVFLLDWSQAWPLLGHTGTLITDDIDLAKRLRDAVKPPRLKRPEIYIDDDWRNHAAA